MYRLKKKVTRKPGERRGCHSTGLTRPNIFPLALTDIEVGLLEEMAEKAGKSKAETVRGVLFPEIPFTAPLDTPPNAQNGTL